MASSKLGTDVESLSFQNGRWLNRPQVAEVEANALTLTTDAKTDFWRDTFYGFTRDSGHALLFDRSGGFTAEIRVRAKHEELYDQAGLMVRIDEAKWLKFGTELTDGAVFLSTVVTDRRSDWSVARLDGNMSDLRLRVTVDRGYVRVQASTDGRVWPLVRLAPFPVSRTYFVGPMAATPERSGFRAEFSDFLCGPPSGKDLHDLT